MIHNKEIIWMVDIMCNKLKTNVICHWIVTIFKLKIQKIKRVLVNKYNLLMIHYKIMIVNLLFFSMYLWDLIILKD